MAEFLSAVRTRNLATAARPAVAHLSCVLVHLGEIAFHTQGRLDLDPATGQCAGCEEANRMLTKTYREPYGLPT